MYVASNPNHEQSYHWHFSQTNTDILLGTHLHDTRAPFCTQRCEDLRVCAVPVRADADRPRRGVGTTDKYAS
jgi:hypothetical protein